MSSRVEAFMMGFILPTTIILLLVFLVALFVFMVQTPTNSEFVGQCRETCASNELVFMGVELSTGDHDRCICIVEEEMYPE